MKKVWILWHVYDDVASHDEKLIGVYSSEELANEAQRLSSKLPEFRSKWEHFTIHSYEINKSDWTEQNKFE